MTIILSSLAIAYFVFLAYKWFSFGINPTVSSTNVFFIYLINSLIKIKWKIEINKSINRNNITKDK